MKVYIGSDHRGYKLKEEIFQYLVEKGYKMEDFGAYEYIKDDDYTEYAKKVASVVGNHYVEKERSLHKKHGQVRGILFCGSGVGVDIVANKFDGVRASIGKEVRQVEKGRSDDDMNILVIAADFTDLSEVKRMIDIFLSTKFSGKKRHKRRLEEIKRIEENN
ncbi:RpiB/LacA/LacB family sugar-phosphate isomerase [Candidatus Woesebacteria bacterium]|nr:RpiB/LacA/LacB family sugar-phosphate isomerase [Candidatus Woesebacteria bacterium]